MNLPSETLLQRDISQQQRMSAADSFALEPTCTPQIRVLIADDHVIVREGLGAMLCRQPDMRVIAEADNGREAVELWKKHQPDVTLLDLRMPELDGIGTIYQLRQLNSNARIIVLTVHDADEHIYRAIKAGAKAYLLKDAGREALTESIRRVHAGETCVSADLISRLAGRVSNESLSAREMDVLRLMARGHSNKEIATALFISETTVKSHIKSVFGKLNVLSRTEAVATAVQIGLIQLEGGNIG